MRRVTIFGAGPAGASAALGCIAAGGEALLVERSRVRKHRVCGEYLSSEIEPLLERVGLWDEFLSLGPNEYRRVVLHFPGVSRGAPLPAVSWGLSRLRFDSLLLDAACRRGATMAFPQPTLNPGSERPCVVSWGREASQQRGQRLFGFKAHFDAEVTDSIELFFFDGCYVGVNSVEGGATNVCGIAPEGILREMGFDADGLLDRFAPLRERLRGARRGWDWLVTGPLVFGNRLKSTVEEGVYAAGDALSFVDPFTGTGLVAAVYSGLSAGASAAVGAPAASHVRKCRAAIGAPFATASLFRWAWRSGWAGPALRVLPVPLRWLVQATRPGIGHGEV